MSVVIFSNQAGRVVAFTDPGLPAVTAVRLSDFGGFTATRSIITRVGFSGQANANFRHTIGGAVHVYTFGDRIGRAIVSGLCFDTGCDNNEFDGLAHIVNYYDRNRVSERGLPVSLTIGAALSLRAYLMAVNCDVAETTSRVYQFTFDLVLVPIPGRRGTTADKSASSSGSNKGGSTASSGSVGVPFGTVQSPATSYSTLPSLTPASVSGGDIGGAANPQVSIPMAAGNGYAAYGTGPTTGLTAGFN